MRRNQDRLGTAAITPGAQGLGGGERVRGGQGRGRASSDFNGLQALLGNVARVVGKAGEERGQQEARIFHQIREGETPEQFDRRVEQEIAKHLNKNPLLASSSSPAFHKTLSILQGGRASDLISQAVRDRQDELLDLRTDAGVLRTDVPSVSDLVNQETERFRKDHGGLFADGLATSALTEGLRRFQVDYGSQVSAQQNSIREKIGEELLTDEVTLATFKLASLDKVGRREFGLVDNIITELGRNGVSPRDARAHGFAGFLAGVEQIANSKGSAYGHTVALKILQAAREEKTGLSIGGRSVRKSQKEVEQMDALEASILADQEIEDRQFKRDADRKVAERQVFQIEYVAGHLGALLDGDSPRRQAEALIDGLPEEFPDDPDKQALAEEILIRKANELEGQTSNYSLDLDREIEIQSLLNDNTPETVALARELYEENPRSISPESRRDFSKRFREQEGPIREVLALPSSSLLRESRRNLTSALADLTPAARSTLGKELSDAESSILDGAFDLARDGRISEVPAYLQSSIKTFRDQADKRRNELSQRREEFLVKQQNLTPKLTLDRTELDSLKEQGVLSVSEYSTILREFSQSERTHRIAETNIKDELLRKFSEEIRGGRESSLALTNPAIAATLEDPEKLARYRLDVEKEIREGTARIYSESLAASSLEDLKDLESRVLQTATDEILKNNVFAVGDEAPEEGGATQTATQKEARVLDRALFKSVFDKSPSEYLQTKAINGKILNIPSLVGAQDLISRRTRGDEDNTLFRSRVPSIHRVRSAIGGALSVSTLSPKEKRDAAVSFMHQTGIPGALALNGGDYRASRLKGKELVEARKATPFYKDNRSKLQKYVNARHISRLDGAEYAHRNGLRPLLRFLDKRGELGYLAAFDAVMEDAEFASIDPGTAKDFWLNYNKSEGPVIDFLKNSGLVVGNPEYMETISVPVDDASIPFRSSPIDLRVTIEDVGKYHVRPNEFLEGRPVTTRFQGVTYDLTDGSDAMLHFRATRPKDWETIMLRAGIDITSSAEREAFEQESLLLASKFLRKVPNE